MSGDSSRDAGLEEALRRARESGASGEQDEQEQGSVDLAPFILLRLCGHWYAADALRVQKVVVKGNITRVPGRSKHILGVSLVHDTLIPVIDLADLARTTGSPGQGLTEPRLVVLGEGDKSVGVVAEEAYGIEELPRDTQGRARGIIAGETYWRDRQIRYLDVDKLLEAGNDHQRDRQV